MSEAELVSMMRLCDALLLYAPAGVLHIIASYAGNYTSTIYLFGGDNSSGATNTVFACDMSSSSLVWRRLTPMDTVRSCGGATMVDGYVYVTGGFGESASVQRYDIVSDSWCTVRRMRKARFYHATCATERGSTRSRVRSGEGHVTGGSSASALVYVIGGCDEDSVLLAECEVYDPVADEWSDIAPLTVARDSHTAVRWHDGRIIVCGGDKTSGKSCEAYDPLSGKWSLLASLPASRAGHACVVLPHSIAIIGGKPTIGQARICQYDPMRNRWYHLGKDTDVPRCYITAHVVHMRYAHQDGKVNGSCIVVCGGAPGIVSDTLYVIVGPPPPSSSLSSSTSSLSCVVIPPLPEARAGALYF